VIDNECDDTEDELNEVNEWRLTERIGGRASEKMAQPATLGQSAECSEAAAFFMHCALQK